MVFSFFFRKRQPNKARPSRSPQPRRRTFLGVEALEQKATPAATISGYVYHDANNNGLFEAGETALPNVQVQLKKNDTGAIIGTTTTDSSGFYQFVNDNTIQTDPKSITKTVTFNDTDTNFDLSGTIQQFDPSLGTLTSIDVIHDGSITSNILVENTSKSSGSTITGTVSGNLNLIGPGINDTLTLSQNAGSLTVAKFDNVLDFGGTSGGNLGTKTATGTKTTTLTGSAMAGWQGTGSVTVREVATATSSAAGGGNTTAAITSTGRSTITVRYNYIPTNGLQPGSYTVIETQPPNYQDGKDSANNVPIPNSIGTDIITLTLSTTPLTNNNFGELQNGSISGYVYVDTNNNGVKDGGETPISGTLMSLTGFTTDGPVNLTATTNSLGYYEFTNLKPGTYGLTEGNPGSQYIDGKDAVGTQGGTLGNDTITSITMNSGVNGVNNNFGELLPARVAGTVYFDVNANGFLDVGEVGIPNVTITLTGTTDTGALTPQSTITDAAGFYQFIGLRPGTYTITESQPPAYKDGAETLGTLGGLVGADAFSAVAIAMGSNGDKYNFGELKVDDGDVGIQKLASHAQVRPGDNLLYSLNVINFGQGTAQNVVVNDTLPPGVTVLSATGDGWNISIGSGTITATRPSLAQGASSVIWVTVRVGSAAGTLTNTSTVTTTTPDNNPNNNTSTVTTLVSIPTGGFSSLVPVTIGAGASKNDYLSGNPTQRAIQAQQAAYISGLYQKILGRVPDSAGGNAFLAAMYAGASPESIYAAIWNSPEHRLVQANAIYQSVLGRAPSAAERANYAAHLGAGVSETVLARDLYTTAEYTSKNPGTANLTGSLYASITGALPTAQQAAATVQSMNNSPLDSVVAGIQNTNEALANTIRQAYRHILQREGGAAEVNGWIAALRSGVSVDSLYSAFLNSAEFHNLTNTLVR